MIDASSFGQDDQGGVVVSFWIADRSYDVSFMSLDVSIDLTGACSPRRVKLTGGDRPTLLRLMHTIMTNRDNVIVRMMADAVTLGPHDVLGIEMHADHSPVGSLTLLLAPDGP